MTLMPRNLILKRVLVKEHPALALDTGFDADSLEGIRLVKASRGSGWVFHQGTLRPWVTKGVLQEDRRLLIWGDGEGVPEGRSPQRWPQQGEAGREYLRAFVSAWTARAGASEPLSGFSPSAVLPWETDTGWAFVFLPDDLRAVLDSLQPLADRLSWDHYRHPDAVGPASWAFTSAAFGIALVTGTLPWVQADEAHLRQELRTLKRTLTLDELPDRLDSGTMKLWFDALTEREETPPAVRWRAWVTDNRPWDGPSADPQRAQRREQARLRRDRRRGQAEFWRRRGTVITVLGGLAATLIFVVGSIVWGLVKPDPTDTWTPEQVVRGYYSGITNLDSELMRKVTRFDGGQQPELSRDQEEATNLYVIRQVRTAYEKQSPMLDAQQWESSGKPPVDPTRMLYGLAGLSLSHEGDTWTARYHKWASESGEDKVVKVTGFSVVDTLGLSKTDRGWKISTLRREKQPLP